MKKMLYIIFLVVISAILSFVGLLFVAQTNSDLEFMNSKLEVSMIQKDEEILSQYEGINQLNEEISDSYIKIAEYNKTISCRDETITERDKTIIELNKDLRLLRWDFQEAMDEVEFPSPPEIIGEIDDYSLLKFLINFVDNNTSMFFGDAEYKLTTVSEIERFLEWDFTDEFRYVKRSFDCDDFAFRLCGQITIPDWSDVCFGVINSNFHVYNVFVTRENGDLVFYRIEPQNDSIRRVVYLENVSYIIFS